MIVEETEEKLEAATLLITGDYAGATTEPAMTTGDGYTSARDLH